MPRTPEPRPSMQENESFCTKCKQVKTLDQFPKNQRNLHNKQVHYWCKRCMIDHCSNPYDKKNYRARRNAQALYRRRVTGSKLPITKPVRAKATTWEESNLAEAKALRNQVADS